MKTTIETTAGMPAVAGLTLKSFIGKGERAKSIFRRACVLAVWLGQMFIGTNVALLGVQSVQASTTLYDVQFNLYSQNQQTGAAIIGQAGDYWNRLATASGTSALANTAGNMSGVSFTWAGTGLLVSGDANPSFGNGDSNLMDCYIFYSSSSGPQNMTFSNLTANAPFTLYIYTQGDTATTGRKLSVTFNGSTYTAAAAVAGTTSFVSGQNYLTISGTITASGTLPFSYTYAEGEADINGIQLSVADFAPTISTEPASQTVAAGGMVNLSVTASGTGPLAYQWLKNGGMVLGATNNALTFSSAGVTNSGVYYVVVANAYGLNISQPVTVAVGNPQLLAWGDNTSGQLGDGTTTQRNSPESVASNVVMAAAGESHSLYLASDGTLWAMGDNSAGELGDGTTIQRNSPVAVIGGSNVVSVAAGTDYSLFVKADGTLWAMGDNSAGELGDGTTIQRNSPVFVASNVVSVAAGFIHTLFLESNGTLWAMGNNAEGQLGDGTTTQQNSPVAVIGGSNVVAMAAGSDHSMYLKSDGTLWVMGLNNYGQLGDGSTSSKYFPECVASNVTAAAAGYSHSLYSKSDGTLWAMGDNSAGELGDGTTIQRNSPVAVINGSNVVSVAAGWDYSVYLKNDGTLWAMGDNSSGSLGDGTTTSTNLPVRVPGISPATAVSSCNSWHTLAVGMGLPPVITSQPTDQTVMAGSPVTFTVAAGGFQPLNYQWQLNGTNLVSATNDSYTLTSVALSDAGDYAVIVTNNYGSTVSLTATLTVTNQPPPSAIVTVFANPSDAGTVTGGGEYIVGSNAVLTATASNNWQFVNWNDGSTDNPRAITVPATNITYTANFGAAATITVDVNPTNSGIVTGGGTFLVGSTNLITAVASNGWAFVQWNDGATNNPYSIVVTSNQSYTANFAATATITVTASPNNGGSVTGGGTFLVDSTNQITAVASNGWTFTGWGDGIATNPRSIVVTSNQTFTANFASAATVTIVIYPANAGAVVSGGGVHAVGSNAVLTASIPASTNQNQWIFLNWNGTVRNYAKTGDTNSSLSFTVTSDITVTANFAQVTSDGFVYLVVPKGTSSPQVIQNRKAAPADSLDDEEEIELVRYVGHEDDVIIPDEIDGYPIGRIDAGAFTDKHYEEVSVPEEDSCITLEGSSLDTAVLDLTAITDTAEIAIDAEAAEGVGAVLVATGATAALIGVLADIFADLDYVQVAVSPSNGGQGHGCGFYLTGTTAKLTASPNSGWRFGGWADGDTNNPREVLVNGSETYTANLIQQSTVTVLANPTNDAGVVTGSGTYDVGTPITLTATAEEGWEFHDWSDGSLEETNEIEVPDHDVTYTATFYVEVEVEAEPPMGGTVGVTDGINIGTSILGAPTGSFPLGDLIQIGEVTNPGWRFNGWVADGFATNVPTFVTLAAPNPPPLSVLLKYKAKYVQVIQVIGAANPTNAGCVEGGGQYDIDETNITLTATASNNWVFINWNDGSTNNPYTIPQITITNMVSITYTANFEAAPIITVSAGTNTLTLAWPAGFLGWILQAQTNDINSSNWFDLPGTGASNSAEISVDPANPEVFYRLRQP